MAKIHPPGLYQCRLTISESRTLAQNVSDNLEMPGNDHSHRPQGGNPARKCTQLCTQLNWRTSGGEDYSPEEPSAPTKDPELGKRRPVWKRRAHEATHPLVVFVGLGLTLPSSTLRPPVDTARPATLSLWSHLNIQNFFPQARPGCMCKQPKNLDWLE